MTALGFGVESLHVMWDRTACLRILLDHCVVVDSQSKPGLGPITCIPDYLFSPSLKLQLQLTLEQHRSELHGSIEKV